MLVYDSEKVKEKIWLILSELWAWMLPQFNIMSPYINNDMHEWQQHLMPCIKFPSVKGK